ncbi:MAG: hypothetical protein WAV38_38405, partial [Xanthobacteraceae bacterium]
ELAMRCAFNFSSSNGRNRDRRGRSPEISEATCPCKAAGNWTKRFHQFADDEQHDLISMI